MQNLIINFTPTGNIPAKKNTPHVPIQPHEIIEQVIEAYELGITLVHLHAREPDESPSYKASIYQIILEGIRKYCPDLVLGVSLSGRNFQEFEKRTEVLSLKPDMASLTLGSLNFKDQASINSPEMILKLAEKIQESGAVAELECFDAGMVNYGLYLIKKHILKPPYYFNILTGNIFGMPNDMAHIGMIIKDLPEKSLWALGGLGSYQLQANTFAIVSGGGVRIGLEDNIWFDKNKTELASNISLLKRIHQLAEIHERSVMKPLDFGNLGFFNRQSVRILHNSIA
jgi:3-keto-5-aminohexanoate cleavage enzyme